MGLFHKETEEERRQKELAKLGDRLIRSAGVGDTAAMQACLAEGASASYIDRYGFTPLMHSAKEGHVAASKLLLESGAEVNTANPEDGATALHLAACGGEPQCLGLLLDAGADSALRMKDQSTAPMLAAIVGLGSVLRIFCAHGVDLVPLAAIEGLTEEMSALIGELTEEPEPEPEPESEQDGESSVTMAVVPLEIVDGSAGFTCEKGSLTVSKLDEGGAAAAAGVAVGMRCVAFQEIGLAEGTTWSELKAKVKATPKPWSFYFAAAAAAPPPEADTSGWAGESGGAGLTAHESLTRGLAQAQAAELARLTAAQLQGYRETLLAELGRVDAEQTTRDTAAAAEAAAETASASRVGDAMAMLGPPLAQYAPLFSSLAITVELVEALGDDEESWADLFEEGCDLAAVEPSDRAALVAAAPAIAAAAAAAAGAGDEADC